MTGKTMALMTIAQVFAGAAAVAFHSAAFEIPNQAFPSSQFPAFLASASPESIMKPKRPIR